MRQVKKCKKKKVEGAIMVEEQGTFRKERETRRKKPSRRASRSSSRKKRAPVSFWTRLPRTKTETDPRFQRRPLGSGIKGPERAKGHLRSQRGGFPKKQMVRSKFSYHSIDRARPRSNDDDNQNPVFILGGVEVPH